MQQSRMSFEISRKFIMSLTPGEIEIIKGASDLSRMNSEVYINMKYRQNGYRRTWMGLS